MSSAATPPRIAVVGVSSLIGAALIEELRARKFPHSQLHALDDARSAGAPGGDDEAKLAVGDIAAFDFSQVDLAFFCGRAALSERYAQAAAEHAWVIDGSAAFRARADVQLIAADVNPHALERVGDRGLIALPGSASVALATALAPLHAHAGLKRVEVATYQAVSGSGRGAHRLHRVIRGGQRGDGARLRGRGAEHRDRKRQGPDRRLPPPEPGRDE